MNEFKLILLASSKHNEVNNNKNPKTAENTMPKIPKDGKLLLPGVAISLTRSFIILKAFY